MLCAILFSFQMWLESGRPARTGHKRASARAVPYGGRFSNQMRYDWLSCPCNRGFIGQQGNKLYSGVENLTPTWLPISLRCCTEFSIHSERNISVRLDDKHKLCTNFQWAKNDHFLCTLAGTVIQFFGRVNLRD